MNANQPAQTDFQSTVWALKLRNMPERKVQKLLCGMSRQHSLPTPTAYILEAAYELRKTRGVGAKSPLRHVPHPARVKGLSLKGQPVTRELVVRTKNGEDHDYRRQAPNGGPFYNNKTRP